MRKLLIKCVFFLVIVTALLGVAVPAMADNQWEPPLTTPAAYNQNTSIPRVYGYEQRTRFWVNEHGWNQGAQLGQAQEESQAIWGSVFYIPGIANSGYTALTTIDQGSIPVNSWQWLYTNFLQQFGLKQDSGTGDWLVSPAYYDQQPDSPFSTQSGLDNDVPMNFWTNPPAGTKDATGAVTLTPPIGGPASGYSPTNPYPVYLGYPADVAAGYLSSGDVKYWEAYGLTSDYDDMAGIMNMTQAEASILYSKSMASTGNVIISYPFGTEIASLTYESSTWTAYAVAMNSTPYMIENENWYAYSVNPVTQQATQIAQGIVPNIPALSVFGVSSSQALPQEQFSFPVPQSALGYELVVTLGETLDQNGNAVPMDLSVYNAYTGALCDNSPKAEIADTDVVLPGNAGTFYDPPGTQQAYLDNAMYLFLPSGSGTSPALVVTPHIAGVVVGQTQQYDATYYPEGQANGNGQDVTTSSAWSSGNTGIATVVATGAQGGLATGVATGTTGITASYRGLQASAQLNVAQGTVTSQYNIAVTGPDLGDASGVGVGGTYTATTTFTSDFPNGGDVQVNWYQQDNPQGGTGDWAMIGQQSFSIGADSTNTISQQWTYPSSGAASVNILVTVDDPLTGLPTTAMDFQNMAFPAGSQGGQMETTYDDNWKEAGAQVPTSPTNIFQSGEAQIPVTTTQTITEKVPYTYYTYSWKKVPIVPGPPYHMGPPHYYLSY